MEITYDTEADAIYIRLAEAEFVRNQEVAGLVGATTWAPDADAVVATIDRLANDRRRARRRSSTPLQS